MRIMIMYAKQRTRLHGRLFVEDDENRSLAGRRACAKHLVYDSVGDCCAGIIAEAAQMHQWDSFSWQTLVPGFPRLIKDDAGTVSAKARRRMV